MEERSPGLLLQATAYLGKQKILKVLTPGVGLISLLAKTVKDSSLTSPFCLGEWVYKKGQKDLHLLIDASLVSSLPDLRKSYQTLCAAGQIAQDLLRTSMPGVYSPELFTLASSIFQKMGSFDHPEVLVLVFRLKWLLQEGLFSFRSTCALCSAPARHVHEGESYCSFHAFFGSWAFSQGEWTHLEELLSARTFSDLRKLTPNPPLYAKLTLFFQERMQA